MNRTERISEIPVKLVKICPKATEEDESTSFSAGIFEVRKEGKVSRTYSNGLSFKHIPGTMRWYYKSAVAERVRRLGLESAQQCQEYAPEIIALFTRWRQLKEEFKATKTTENSSTYLKLKEFGEHLHLPCSALPATELFDIIRDALEYRNPKFLAAKFAELCKDRSNLGQSSFLRLVGVGRGYYDAIGKIGWLAKLFRDEPQEFVSFLLFGRAPCTERRFSWRFRCYFVFARNFLVGVHNKFKFWLKRAQIELPEASLLLDVDYSSIIKLFEAELQQKLEEMKKIGSNITSTKRFVSAVKNLRKKSSIITELFSSEDFTFTWKYLKKYAEKIKGVSFSALRAVLVRACLHQTEWSHAIERCIRWVTPENTLKKPFHERTCLKPLPIDLIMGRKYVIFRPGNANKMRELILRDGAIWFEIPKVNLNGTPEKAKACWHAPKRAVLALEKGAKINLFRFIAPQNPGNTIKVGIVLSGNEESFVGTAHLRKNEYSNRTASKSVLGLDVNRLGEHVFTATFDLGLSEVIQKETSVWNDLETIIGALQKKLETTRNWKKQLKLKSEVRLLHRRRANLRSELLKKIRVHLGTTFVELGVEFVGLEGNLQKDAKDKKGGLAKAISSMPDNVSLVAKEVIAVNMEFKRDLKLALVRKEGTSRYHYCCGGILERTGDFGRCRACGAVVNSHENSARNIEERASNLVRIYNKDRSSGGAPSAC